MLHPLSQTLRDSAGLVDTALNKAAADELDRLTLHVADLTQILAKAAVPSRPPAAQQTAPAAGLSDLQKQIANLTGTIADLTTNSAQHVNGLRAENASLRTRIAELEAGRGD